MAQMTFSTPHYASGAYNHLPPHAYTAAEKAGRDGVLIASAHLRKQGYLNILINQDRNNHEKHMPDILAYHPETGWIQMEVHRYYYRQTISTHTANKKNNKKWHPNIPKHLTYIHKINLTPQTTLNLQKQQITLHNGLHPRTTPMCSMLNSELYMLNSSMCMVNGCSIYSDVSCCVSYGGLVGYGCGVDGLGGQV